MKRLLIYTIIASISFTSCQKKPQKHARSIDAGVSKAHPLTDKAYDLLDANKPDSAFKVFDQARELYLINKDSLMSVNALTNMAMIAIDAGDNFNAQEYSLETLKFLNVDNKKHHPYLISSLNSLGMAAYNLKKYDEAIDFYHQAQPLIADSVLKLTNKNNLANAYRQKGDYPIAIKLYKEILLADPSDTNKARTLTNLAKTQFLQNSTYNPVPSYLEGLQIRKRLNDRWGQNSSYSHLADYYLNTKPDSSLYYSRSMYQLALALNNPDNELEALAKLAELEPTKRLTYFKRYRQLDDSLKGVRDAAKNQFALIRYQTEKHKTDKLRLEKENEQKKVQLARRNTLLIIAIVVILATIIISIIIYRYRKRRIAEQAEKQISDSKLKTSKEIHDVVANGLYRMMSEVEYSDFIDKSKLVGQIEKLYNQSRQISHTVSANPMDFVERLEELIHAFSNPETKIITAGLEDELNTSLSVPIKDEIVLAIQELLVNMSKYSGASQVVLRFILQQNQLEIRYRDNGVGLSEDKKGGTGIRNTESRIVALKGLFIFGNHGNGGVHATIQVPLT